MCGRQRHVAEPGGLRAGGAVRRRAVRGGGLAVPGLRRHQARHRLQGSALRDRGPHEGEHRGEDQVNTPIPIPTFIVNKIDPQNIEGLYQTSNFLLVLVLKSDFSNANNNV